MKWFVLDMLATGYSIVALLVFLFHIVYLQMVTTPLAFWRAVLWPIFWATGWPHGTPLPMD